MLSRIFKTDPATAGRPATIDVAAIAEEVAKGLPCGKDRRDRAARNAAFWDYDGERYCDYFRRDAEGAWDQQGRPHRESGFSREVIEVLTDHLYCPGPSRTWSDDAGQTWLDQVYSDNHVDAVMARADQLAHRSEVAAIQVDAAAGEAEKPITLRLWSAEHFEVWVDPDEPTKAAAVCTIDRYDLQTRYRLWTKDEVRTFVTTKAEGTTGGRVAEQVEAVANTYGVVPFAFIHFDLPIQKFWTSSPGDLLVDTEIRVDDRLSRLDESIHKHLNPVAWVKGMPRGWTPVLEPGRFLRLAEGGAIPTPGGMTTGQGAEIGHLQATIDVAGAWTDCLNYVNQVLEAARAPLSAVRMDQQGVASGISLIVEQAPLLGRARKRRGPFGVYEQALARLILLCSGNHYDRPELTASAKSGRLSLGWPQPSLAIPTPDRLEMITGEVAVGWKSQLQAIGEWYGVPRDQALAIVAQIEADDAELKRIAPKYAEAVLRKPAEPPPGPDDDEDPGDGPAEPAPGRDDDEPDGDD